MIQIGKLTIDAPFFQAGLAGYSDAAMRLVARRHGAPYAVTEAMLDQFLIHGGKGLAAAELDHADHPIAGQLMGSHPAEIAAGSKILVKLGYDVIDINLACPVKKIRKKARGGHLMQEPDDAVAILDAVRQAVGDDRPCTVKLRRGTDDSAEAQRNFHRIFERVIDLGYAGAVVHGRTVEQKYLGPSRWEFLRGIVTQYGTSRQPEVSGRKSSDVTALGLPTADRLLPTGFLIGGSGDIWTAADIFRMIRETGVRLVSVARGCIGNPWIFRQARAMMAGDHEASRRAPTIGQQREVLLDHFQLSVDLHGEKKAGMTMRKFGIKFSRHHPQGPDVAREFIAVKSLEDWRGVLERYYHDLTAPGMVADMASGPVPSSCDDEGESCEPAAVEPAVSGGVHG
jgi:tRNA-dihydrouridine synthase